MRLALIVRVLLSLIGLPVSEVQFLRLDLLYHISLVIGAFITHSHSSFSIGIHGRTARICVPLFYATFTVIYGIFHHPSESPK